MCSRRWGRATERPGVGAGFAPRVIARTFILPYVFRATRVSFCDRRNVGKARAYCHTPLLPRSKHRDLWRFPVPTGRRYRVRCVPIGKRHDISALSYESGPSRASGRGTGGARDAATMPSRLDWGFTLQSPPGLSPIRRKSALFMALNRLSMRIESGRRNIGNATADASTAVIPIIPVIMTAVCES